jgi:hypothetical protein
MDLGLKGLCAVVTGAADIFAQEGASVAICARNAALGTNFIGQ